MSLIIMKFGGTSTSTPENRANAICHIARELDQGHKVVAVVSAMGRNGAPYATDTLLSLLEKGADPVTTDLMMSCGETIAACVFSHELNRSGVPAMAFTGESAGLCTNRTFGNAEILSMDTKNIDSALRQGLVPVITGFQGRTKERLTTTLGRGGSDVSAVVIGGYLHADTVDIYTDVRGVAKADPRIIPQAEFLKTVSSADMLTLAQWGASVIHPRAVSAALEHQVPRLRVRSTFDLSTGTSILAQASEHGFIGLAMLQNMVETSDGEFACRTGRYTKATHGPWAIITAIYKGCGRTQQQAIAAISADFAWEGDVVRGLVPMERSTAMVVAIYNALIKN